jgi:hypothetical protein
VEHEWRPAASCSCRHGHEPDYKGAEGSGGAQPAGETEPGHETAAEPEVASKESGPGSLTLEVEELAALVSDVGREQEEQAEKAEKNGTQRCAGEHDQRTAGQRIAGKLRRQCPT